MAAKLQQERTQLEVQINQLTEKVKQKQVVAEKVKSKRRLVQNRFDAAVARGREEELKVIRFRDLLEKLAKSVRHLLLG